MSSANRDSTYSSRPKHSASMTAFFCSRSVAASSLVPRSSTDDRICRSWMRVSPEVSCARRPAGRSDFVANHSASRIASTKRQPLGFVRPIDLDFDRLRRSHDARADVGEVLGDQHERDVRRQQRRIGRPLLDEDAHGAIFGARLRRTTRESAFRRRAGSRPRRAAASRWIDLLQERIEQREEHRRIARQRSRQVGAVHGVDHGHRVGEVLVRFAGVKGRRRWRAGIRSPRRAGRTSSRPRNVGQRHEAARRRRGRWAAAAPGRACCRAG